MNDDSPKQDDRMPEQDELALRERLFAAAELFESLIENRGQLAVLNKEEQTRFLKAAGRVVRPERGEARRLRRERHRRKVEARRNADEAILSKTAIRRARTAAMFATPSRDAPRQLEAPNLLEAGGPELSRARICYICKTDYVRPHHFYDAMCEPCGEVNLAGRFQTADLTGRCALLTGGRVKIGYQAGIKLLRAGCRLIVTTRFPNDAARRYAQEDDAADWLDRLSIHGLDLRHSPSVEAFCQTLLKEEQRLDFIINNACQTVRRPAGFYQHLMEAERNPALLTEKANGVVARSTATSDEGLVLTGGADSAERSQVALLPEDFTLAVEIFPDGQLDADEQQVDLREVNSWRLMLDEVPTIELLEVQLVNAVAPFIINARLKPLMTRSPERDKHIVNVSAMEGQFYRTLKTARHPHTNMAKAALNMLTRTSAPDYFDSGIHMNSVDTGWVTDEDPAKIAERKVRDHNFHPPLDIVDGAARIVAPIFEGMNSGQHVWGRFLKDYTETDW